MDETVDVNKPTRRQTSPMRNPDPLRNACCEENSFFSPAQKLSHHRQLQQPLQALASAETPSQVGGDSPKTPPANNAKVCNSGEAKAPQQFAVPLHYKLRPPSHTMTSPGSEECTQSFEEQLSSLLAHTKSLHLEMKAARREEGLRNQVCA